MIKLKKAVRSSFALLVLMLIGQPAYAQDTAQSVALPFQMIEIQGSTMLMRQYFQSAMVDYNFDDAVNQDTNSDAKVSGSGPLANFVYVVPNTTNPAQIIASYRNYLEPLGYKIATDSTGTPHQWANSVYSDICSRYTFCGWSDDGCGVLGDGCTNGTMSAVLVNPTPAGNSIVAIYVSQINKAMNFIAKDAQTEDQVGALVAQKPLKSGDNYLLISVSWPQVAVLKLVQSDAGITKTPDAPAMPAAETAANIAKALHEHGKIDIYGILFDSNKASLKPESTTTIAAIGDVLKNDPTMNVLIIGHTDNVGTAEYNQKLSSDRAKNVAAELQKKYGIDAKRMTFVGKGLTEPVASNDTDEGRAKNRRVEFKVVQ